MMSEPSMIDMMSEDEVRSACKSLAIDVERKRRRIKKLQARLDEVQEAHDNWKRTEDDDAADECFADKVLAALGEKE
jgi:hypothetical protein